MTCAIVLLLTTLFLMTTAAGEEVTLKVKHPELDEHFRCVFPLVISVKVERARGEEEIPELFLAKSEVVSSNRHIHLMGKDADGVVRFALHEVRELEVLGTQAYHNHTAGASFIVKCVVSDTGRLFFRLVGSLYFGKLKYRLSPNILANAENDAIRFESQRVAVMSSMTTEWEFAASDAQGVEYISNDGIVSSGTEQATKRIDYVPPVAPNSDETNHDNEEILSSSGHNRYRRATNTYYVDILPIVDYSTFALWNKRYEDEDKVKAELNTYLANTLTAVDMRLQTLQLDGAVLHVRMVTPVISTDPSSSPYTENIKVKVDNETKVSAPALLRTFNEWVEAQTTLPPHDHAMLFTSYDLVPSENTNEILTAITKGLANVAALCKNGSISLVEDKGAYQSENVAAHELGHGLGSKHDGDDNNCKPTDRYMMSPSTYPQTDSNLLHPWQFSTCSSAAISVYIKSLEQDSSALQDCLLRQYGTTVTSDLQLSAKAVCEMYYGNTSFPCTNVANSDEICTKLRCRTTEDANCILIVPPTGTCCDTSKACSGGKCVNGTDGTCQIDSECPLGDQPSVQLNNGPAKTCGEYESAYCYLEDFRTRCCVTCRGHYTKSADCPYGDRVLGCSSTVTDVATCKQNVNDVNSKCCGTCGRLATPATTSTTTTITATTATTTATSAPTVQPSAADSTTANSKTTAESSTIDAATSPTEKSESSDSTSTSTVTAASTASSSSSSSPTTTATTTTTTTRTIERDVYGYKPDGFIGCYLPPCSAKRLFNPFLVWALILACMVIARAW